MKLRILFLLLLACVNSIVFAQINHSFTYQGQLTDNGSPAQGSYDIIIKAFDNVNATGGLLSESVHNSVSIESGLFTIQQVDLDSFIFDGMEVWLQILVKKTSDLNYTALSPLQKMGSVPYANSLIDKGAADGQVLTFNSVNGWQPVTPNIGTDDQNISGSELNGTNLTIGIEGGNNQIIDLASIQDGTGTDDQNITGSELNGTNLTIGIEDGNNQIIDLASLQDGTGTDDQNIAGSELNGTNLTIGIEGGNSQIIDLASLQDGTGTDNQNLSLLGNTLSISGGANVNFTGWDTNTSDDFSGSFTDLTNIPAGIADGDDNTTYSGSDFVTSNQTCTTGQIITGVSAAGNILCSNVVATPPNCDQNNQSLQYTTATGWACVNNHRNYVWTTGSTNTDPLPVVTSWTDMPDLDLNPISITTTGGDIKFGWSGSLWCEHLGTNQCSFYFRILVDGVSCGNQTLDEGFGYIYIPQNTTNGNGASSRNYNIAGFCSASPGVHTLKMQYKLTDSDMQFRHFSSMGKFLLWAEEM